MGKIYVYDKIVMK